MYGSNLCLKPSQQSLPLLPSATSPGEHAAEMSVRRYMSAATIANERNDNSGRYLKQRRQPLHFNNSIEMSQNAHIYTGALDMMPMQKP